VLGIITHISSNENYRFKCTVSILGLVNIRYYYFIKFIMSKILIFYLDIKINAC